jgi:hypothetical protein
MGGYQISYESFRTYVEKQAIMAKNERARARESRVAASQAERPHPGHVERARDEEADMLIGG